MTWRVLDDDPVKTEFFNYDDTTGDSVYKTQWKGTNLVTDFNKEHQTKESGRNPANDMWHVARIPPAIIHKWLVEEGLNVFSKEHGERLMKKLDDPEWQYLRVNTARLGKRSKHF